MNNITYQRAIVVIRNPYESLLAEFNRRKGGHVYSASKKAFMGPGTVYFFINELQMVKPL